MLLRSASALFSIHTIDEARVILAVQHKSKFNLDLFKKKHQIYGFPSCTSTHEDLSIDASITTLGVRTDIDEARVILELQHKLNCNLNFFEKKIKFWDFYVVVATCEDLSIDL